MAKKKIEVKDKVKKVDPIKSKQETVMVDGELKIKITNPDGEVKIYGM